MSFGGTKKIKPSPLEIALTDQAVKQWQDFQKYYIPVEQEMMQRYKQFGTQPWRQNAAGRVASGVWQGLEKPEMQPMQPAGNRFAMLRDRAFGAGAGVGAGTAMAGNAELNRGAEAGLAMLKQGRGIEAASSQALGAAAAHQAATRQAKQLAESSMRGSWMELGGKIAGMAGDKWFNKDKPGPGGSSGSGSGV